MMKHKLTILFISIGLLAMSSCTQAPKADEAKTEAPKEVKSPITDGATQSMNVDIKASSIRWIGTKPVGKHSGTISLKNGSLVLVGNQLKAGKFTIDMNSIAATDQDADSNQQLSGHLKSDDFFKVSEFPEADFVITKTSLYKESADSTQRTKLKGTTHMITGNLTMLGTAKSITFPARIFVNQNGLSAEANFNINRTDWGITYGSDKSLGDRFIRPEINLSLTLSALIK